MSHRLPTLGGGVLQPFNAQEARGKPAGGSLPSLATLGSIGMSNKCLNVKEHDRRDGPWLFCPQALRTDPGGRCVNHSPRREKPVSQRPWDGRGLTAAATAAVAPPLLGGGVDALVVREVQAGKCQLEDVVGEDREVEAVPALGHRLRRGGGGWWGAIRERVDTPRATAPPKTRKKQRPFLDRFGAQFWE